MRLTPAEVVAIAFQRAPLGRRGYNEEQVDAFVHQVEQELVQLFNERAELQAEVGRLRQRVRGDDHGGADGAAWPEDGHLHAVRILSKAQQTADQYVADAEKYSRQLAEDARRHADEILSDAKARAVMVLEEAHRQASSAASSAAASAPPGADDDRRGLESEVAYLRTFSQVYRTHLRSYLEALLRNVDEWERAEHGSIAVVRHEQLRG